MLAGGGAHHCDPKPINGGTMSGLQTNSGKRILDNRNVPPHAKGMVKRFKPYYVRILWTSKWLDCIL